MGDTQECLEHFFELFPADATRPLLAEFCKVIPDTVARWQRDSVMPLGDELIRLRVFLQLAGYEVSEYLDLMKPVKQLAQIIAFDVFGLEVIRDALGYKNVQALYDVVLRGQGLMPNKLPKLQRILADGKEELDKLNVLWTSRIEALLDDDVELARRARAISAPAEPTSTPMVEPAETPPSVEIVNHLVLGLIAALEGIDDDPNRRGRIVNKIGHGRLDKLIIQLQMLDRS